MHRFHSDICHAVVDVSHPLYQQYTVTQEEKEKFNPYVLLNEETHQYSIQAEAATGLALPGGIIFDYNIILSAISPSMVLDIFLCVIISQISVMSNNLKIY